MPPIPASMTFIRVQATYVHATGDTSGVVEQGKVTFEGPFRLVSTSDNVIMTPAKVEVPLNSSGALDIYLPATNDPDWGPINFTYKVTEQLQYGGTNTYNIELPYDLAGGVVNLADLAPLPADGQPGILYVTTSGGGGGGGSGTVTQVNGQNPDGSGHVTLVPANIGAAASVHTHGAGDITSGTLAIARIPVGTTSGTVAAGDDGRFGAMSDATTVAKGAVQLAGDLGGTAAAPTVPRMHTRADFYLAGAVTVGTGNVLWRNNTGQTLNIVAERAECVAAPTGGSITVDINKNGTTIFTTQSNRPVIAAGATDSGLVTSQNVTTLAPNDYLTVDVDGIGSGGGSDLFVTVVLR